MLSEETAAWARLREILTLQLRCGGNGDTDVLFWGDF